MLDQLEQLRTELADRAFVLDRCGRADAADLAHELVGRIGELIADGRSRLRESEISAESCPERPASFVG